MLTLDSLSKGLKGFVALVLMSSSSAQGQEVTRSLSLTEYLTQVEANDLELQKILIDRAQLKYRRDLVLPNRAFIVDVRQNYGIALDNNEITNSLTASITKPFPSTGTSISLSVAQNDQIIQNEKTARLMVNQELLKNAFGAQVRKQEKVLSAEEALLQLQIAETYEDYLREAIERYMELRLAYLNVQAAEGLYSEIQKLETNIRARRRNSIASEADVGRVVLQVYSRRAELQQARNDLQSLSEVLSASLSDQRTVFIPSSEAHYHEASIDFDAVVKKALTDSRTFQMHKYGQRATGLQTEIYKDELRPSLILQAGVNYDNSERFSSEINRSEGLLGVNLGWAIDDTRTKALLNQSQLQIRKAELDELSYRRNLIANAESLKVRIQEQRELMKLLEEKYELSRSVVNQVQRRYEIGRADLDSLINAQNEMAQTRFSSLASTTQLNKYIVQWLALTDNLLTAKASEKLQLDPQTTRQ